MNWKNSVAVVFACLFQVVKAIVWAVAWCVIILCVLTKRR